MFAPDDTIVAIATPPGRGGIGVVRVSGPDADRIARAISDRATPFEPRQATFSRVNGAEGTIDQAVLTFFPAPRSYTGEDVVEISAHGSPVLLAAIVKGALAAGARLAEPGEFTLRAYLHGRIDLVQAEAVRDLVDAVTPLQARAAFDQLEGTLTERIRAMDAALLDLTARLEASLDFPEEGYHFVEPGGAAQHIQRTIEQMAELLRDSARGRMVREGAQIAILGRPNVGKSSLFNRLAGVGRAIVTDIPGTTRDVLTEVVDVGGVPMTVVDTAGIRGVTADPVEAEGMARAHGARQVATLVVIVLDRSQALANDDWALLEVTAGACRLVVANKSDLPAAWDATTLGGVEALAVSAATGDGLDRLRDALATTIGASDPRRDPPAVTNVRHAALLQRAHDALLRAASAAEAGAPEELVVMDIAEARALLEDVTGTRTADDILRTIFESFCIGK